MKAWCQIMLISAVLFLPAYAEPNEADPRPERDGKVKALESISVAIIDFESRAPGNEQLGSQIGDILTARLSIYDRFQLVERQKLADLLSEHELNLTGMVETGEAVKVGKMLGARIMVFGRAFSVDKDLYIVAKIVGTESTKVKGVMAKGKLESELSGTIDQLVEKLAEGLNQWAPELLPKDEKLVDKVEVLKTRLAGRELPPVAVAVSEMHVSRQVIDPAAQTEIRKVLAEIGFRVVEAEGRPDNPSYGDAQIVVEGEGFSEFAARLGGLYSCTARLEIKVREVGEQELIASARTTRRAIDLSEMIAGKTALQIAGHHLGIQIAEKLADRLEEGQN